MGGTERGSGVDDWRPRVNEGVPESHKFAGQAKSETFQECDNWCLQGVPFGGGITFSVNI